LTEFVISASPLKSGTARLKRAD